MSLSQKWPASGRCSRARGMLALHSAAASISDLFSAARPTQLDQPVRMRSDHCSMSWRDSEGRVVTVWVTSLEGSMSP